MSISKLASTVILATSFATIFLFAFIFYLYGGERSVLEDALSMTASFFGGIATLVAAYVATQLFNDWRDQHRAAYISSVGDNVSNMLSDIFQKIIELDLVILNSEVIKGSKHMAFVVKKDQDEIFKNIPLIEDLCREILCKVINLDIGITQLQIVSEGRCNNVEQYYLDFKDLVKLEVEKILKDPDAHLKYQKISGSRKLISLALPKYKSLQEIIYEKIYDLNNPK
ncbi:hypothetical protein ABEF81_08545 [Acinetobacter thermotolerans]|uniref:hypothetical protein n=1 Tax=Acinetobacter thermotolerans TaxID=3151487 RepID=UPI00325B7472